MARVFISHSSRDNEPAARIKVWLSNQGFETPFLDFDKHAGIPPGADWERTLYREIERSEAIIIIQTPNWLDSKWCFVEFTQARALGKPIFPIIETPTGDTLISPDIQTLDLRSDRAGGLERLSRQLTQIALDAQGGFAWDKGRPPYPGLLAFQEEDAALYFGRDDDIRRLIERLNARRAQGGAKLIALLGASGSGKSSLLRAGVIARLKRSGRNWIVLPPMRPQVRPVDELARCLAVACGGNADWRKLHRELSGKDAPETLDGIANDLRVKTKANEAQILLPIDQAEELFSVADPPQARLFFEILNAALSGDLPFIAVMALRSDYLGLLQSVEHPRVRFEEFSLGPMPLARIPQIIKGPARVAGLHVDDAFVQQAVRDAETTDALPLLAFALRELYDRASDDHYLSLAKYNAMGDAEAKLTPLENSVRKAADEVLDDASPGDEELTALREAFVPAMVRVNDQGEYVRRPARWDRLPAKSHRLLELLAKARLLIVSQQGTERMVEVAHEALLRKWPRLTAWLDEAREFLIGKQQLQNDLRDWERAGERDKPDALLTGLKLNRAREWLSAQPKQLEDKECEYIQASIEQADAEERRRSRQRRIITRASIAAAVVLACFAVVAGWQWWSAKKATISALIESSEARFVANEDWNALMTSLRAAQKFRTLPLVEYFDPDIRSQISQNLQQALYRVKEYKRLRYKLNSGVSRQSALGQMAWSPDGKILAFLSGRDKVTLWTPGSNSLRSIHPNGGDAANDDEVQSVSWKPLDGETLTISSKNGWIKFFDPQGKQLLPSIKPDPDDQDFYGVGWRPDGQELALASFSHGVMVMKPDGTRLDNPLPNLKSQVWSVSWSPDPPYSLAAGGFPNTLMWQNPDNISSPCSVPHDFDLNIWTMSWRPDGKSLAVGLNDNAVGLLSEDCKDGHVHGHMLTGHTGPVSGVSWSSDWRLATASQEDGTVRLWDQEGTLLDTFHIPTVRGGVQWRPDGQVLATVDQYGLVRLWKDNPLLTTFIGRAHAEVTDAALSPDGQILASASGDRINLWRQDRDHRWLSEPTSLRSGYVRSVSWSPDGKLLASTYDDAVTIWNRDGSRKLTLKHEGVENGVLTVSWSPDSKELATGDGKGNITLWDIKDSSILSQTACRDWSQTIAWNPTDDRLLAVGCHNRAGAYLLEWKPNDEEILKTQLLKETNISGVSWSHDGKILATSGNDRINLWGRDGKHIGAVDTGDEVGKVAWSPDGQMLAAASGNVVKLFKVVKSSEHDDLPLTVLSITVLKGHARAVTSVTWNRQTLVSASKDGTVRLWQIDKGFANDLLDTLLVDSCNWLGGYLEKNPLMSKEDSDLQDLCSTVQTAVAPPPVPPTKEKASPAPAQSPAEIKQSSIH